MNAVNIYIYIYSYLFTYSEIVPRLCRSRFGSGPASGAAAPACRLCTLIGVPCRLSMLITFNTFANILF